MTADAFVNPGENTPRVGLLKGRFSKTTLDSFWIMSNYAVTAASGMLFWVFAAKVIHPSELGVETAILSIITAASSVASIGASNATLAMLPAAGVAGPNLLRRAIRSVLLLSILTGLIAGTLVSLFIHTGAPWFVVVPLVTAATALWALFVFKDPSFGALGRIRSAVTLNGIANVVKLGLLILFANIFISAFRPLLVSAAVPLLASVLIWFFILIPKMFTDDKREVQGNVEAPTTKEAGDAWFAEVKPRFDRFTIKDTLNTSLNLGIGLSLSFIVAAVAGAEAGAVFAICYQVSAILDLVVVGASGSLILNNTSGHIDARLLAFKMWLRAFLLVLAVALVLSFAAPTILNFLSPFYVQNGGVATIILLMVGSTFRTAYEVWSSLLRAQHNTGLLLRWNIGFGAALFVLTVSGAILWGAVGCALAVVVLTFLQAIVGMVGILRSQKEANAS